MKFLIKLDSIYLVLQLWIETSANPILIHAQISWGKKRKQSDSSDGGRENFLIHKRISVQPDPERHWEKYT